MQKLMDRDFLSALVLFIIGTVSLVNEGDDLMNWVFPRLLSVPLSSVSFQAVLSQPW